MKKIFLQQLLPLIAVAMIGVTANADQTLLVDFFRSTGATAEASIATAADFAVNDANVDLSATVNALTNGTDGGGVTLTGIGGDATLGAIGASTGTTSFSGYFGPAVAGVGIYNGYFARGNSNGINFDVTDLDFAVGDAVNVVVYGVGDQDDQDGNISVTYDGTTIGPAFQEALNRDTLLPSSSFSFVATTADTITIDNAGDASAFSAVNGFSITATSAVPEPTSLLVLSMGGILAMVRRRR